MSQTSFAACSSPAGVAGEMGFNLTGTNDYEYCNGTNWISMDTGGSGETLVGHWKMDETSGSSIADSFGSNTGTWTDNANNDVTEETTSGLDGTALSFDGTDDYVQITDAAALDLTSAVTISAWVKNTGAGNGGILCKQDVNNAINSNYCLYLAGGSGTYAFAFGNGSSAQYADSTVASDSDWHHFVGVADGTNIKLYVDGTEIHRESQTISLTATAVDLFIGTWDDSANGEFAGDIDDVRLYSVALKPQEVQDLYLSSALVGHWKLDETSGTTATDSSASGNNGAMTSMDGASNTVSGKIGTALSFSSSSRITAGASATNFDDIFVGGGTISYWVYPTNWGTFGRVIDKSDSGTFPPNSGWHSQGTAGLIKFSHAFSTTAGDWQSPASSVLMNEWSHISISYNSDSTTTDPSIYVNGSSVSVTEVTAPVGTAVSDSDQPVTLGARQGGGNNFTGYADDVRIYNMELSSNQVETIFLCSVAGRSAYDHTNHVMKYCGADVGIVEMGAAGIGGGGCAASGSLLAGVEGTMQYDTTNNKMVFCDGANWVNIPN